MISIVTSSNATIFRELRLPTFERIGVDHHVAPDGRQALEQIHRHRPAVAILDAEMPGLSGYEVCRAVKDDPAVHGTRVVLVVEGAITSEIIGKLSRSGCDEFLVTPAAGEELFHKIARLLGLTRRAKRRMVVELRARMRVRTTVVSGRVVDLSTQGARLELERSVSAAKKLEVRITPKSGRAVVTKARVIWEQAQKAGSGVVCGVQFMDVAPSTRYLLEDLAFWDVVELEGGALQMALQGDFLEHTDFSRLASTLAGVVEFDLGGVRYLNSSGVRRWANFLRSLDQVQKYGFVRCSVAFIAQASMAPEVLGRGLVESFHVPYACDGCDLEEERLLQTSALAVAGDWPPELPTFSCPRCSGQLVFDDVPARFFAFLESDPRIQARREVARRENSSPERE